MAKAQFHRNQKVWVESVGAWAMIDKINAVWAKGFDEPVRITYDVGLGREFQAHELAAQDMVGLQTAVQDGWRVMRARNKWQTPEECAHHPHPGTYPVVITEAADWGGWRTPGAEYDRDPSKIERQALLIAAAPRLLALARALIDLIEESPEEPSQPLIQLAKEAAALDRQLQDVPAPPAPRVQAAE